MSRDPIPFRIFSREEFYELYPSDNGLDDMDPDLRHRDEEGEIDALIDDVARELGVDSQRIRPRNANYLRRRALLRK